MSYSDAVAGRSAHAPPLGTLPPDWPGPGPIDLSVHDLPHASSILESWYVRACLETASGRELALIALFLRQAGNRQAGTGRTAWTHSATWSLRDPSRWEQPRRQVPSAVGDDAPQIFPAPSSFILAFSTAGNLLCKTSESSYQLDLRDDVSGSACTLELFPEQSALRCGNGVVRVSRDELMFYYYIPRCAVAGRVVVDGNSEQVVGGLGWYDHEFGGISSERPNVRRSASVRLRS